MKIKNIIVSISLCTTLVSQTLAFEPQASVQPQNIPAEQITSLVFNDNNSFDYELLTQSEQEETSGAAAPYVIAGLFGAASGTFSYIGSNRDNITLKGLATAAGVGALSGVVGGPLGRHIGSIQAIKYGEISGLIGGSLAGHFSK